MILSSRNKHVVFDVSFTSITETFRQCTISTRTTGKTYLQLTKPVNQTVYFFHWMVTRLFFCYQPIKKLMTLKQSESVFDKEHHFNDIHVTFINSITKLKKNRGENIV